MPTVFYSEAEFAELQAENNRLKTKLAAVESLRPMWAQGFTSDSSAAQTMAAALKSVWDELGAENQTQAMALLRQLKAGA